MKYRERLALRRANRNDLHKIGEGTAWIKSNKEEEYEWVQSPTTTGTFSDVSTTHTYWKKMPKKKD